LRRSYQRVANSHGSGFAAYIPSMYAIASPNRV
jgi:hypothetical protein